ncbi:L-dopachrome tautomerase-related protein [Ancylomarina sp.]|uniref:L-dopachrome tautomerase-related protein n=1 Tax=Ancylomarina sp. TaxID=1970196 RepID=UPI003568A45A
MRIQIILLAVILLQSCVNQKSTSDKSDVIEVVQFKGQQVTGVSVSHTGRVFVNFPRWRESVENSVVEVAADGKIISYPSEKWNKWEIGKSISDSVFVAIQSVVAHNDDLYVLDTRNPLFAGVKDAPRLFVFDLNTNRLKDILVLSPKSYKPTSYINDLRIDERNNCIYMTDSGEPGLVVLNLSTKESKRVLDHHYSTRAETDHLTINGVKWNNTVHSDGIAFNSKTNRLYYHSLTGYNLYSVSADLLNNGDKEQIEADVKLVAKTAAPDGMIFDDKGNLYFADLENNKIQYLTPDGKINTLCEGEKIRWADTFSIFNGYLFYTNSRINETQNGVSDLTFSINKIKIED